MQPISNLIKLNKLFFDLVSEFKKKIFFLILLVVFSSLLEVFSIGIFIPGIIWITNPEKISFLANTSFDFLIGYETSKLILYYCFIIICLFGFKAAIFVYVNLFKNKLLISITNHLTENLFFKYLKKNYAFHVKNPSNKLLNTMYETESFVVSTIYAIVNLFSDILICFFMLIFLLTFEFKGTIFIFTFFSLVIFLFIFFIRKKK